MSNKIKIAIVSIFKNEFDFIIEWVAYHRIKGIYNFIIADNVSSDGSSELLQAMDYLGFIKRIYFPRLERISPQVSAYNYVLNEYGRSYDGLIFLDADEFLVCKGNIYDLSIIDEFFRSDRFSALAINWKIYGSNGIKIPPKNGVLESYTKRSSSVDPNCNHIKSLIKPNKIDRVDIHNSILNSGCYCNTMLETNIFNGGLKSFSQTKNIEYNNLHINHYVIKSNTDHFIKKMNKGSAAGKENRQKGVDYFNIHDKNEKEDSFDSSIIDKLNYEIEFIIKKVNNCIHYMPTSKGHVDIDVKKKLITGWVSDHNLSLVRIIVNNKEFIVKVNKRRPDVFKKKLSNGELCGFNLSIDVSYKCDVFAYIYGSPVNLEIKFL